MKRRLNWLWLPLIALMMAPMPASAEPLIPWPWLETNRYSTWKRERDAQRADWYARRSTDPVGSRRRYVKGKFWPPYPRPEGLSMIPSHRFHAAHYWPYPYVCQDRQSVRAFIAAQEDAGWVEATTLFAYHFDRDTKQLNRSGRMHAQWILRTAPVKRRVIYVQTATDFDATEMRIASVATELARMVGAENTPPIIRRVASPLGRSADEVDKIQQSNGNSLPVPRISSPLGGGGGLGGGSGGT